MGGWTSRDILSQKYKKRFLHNTLRLDSEEIIFPVKHYEHLFDLINIPQLFEPSLNENFIRIFSNKHTKTNIKGKVTSVTLCKQTWRRGQ